MEPHEQRTIVDFSALHSVHDVARAIGCDVHLIERTANAPNQFEFYTEHRLPKKNPKVAGDVRLVYEPEHHLKSALRALARRLEDYFIENLSGYPGVYAFGFISGGSTKKNADVHAGASRLLRADIQSFFRSINASMVESALLRAKLQSNIASLLARFATLGGALGEGMPTSPLLANLCCIPLDDELGALARRRGCKYTRYADDMAFSSPAALPRRIEISTILSRFGFSLSARKFRISKRGQAHFVTGLSISDSSRSRIPKLLKRRIRQEMHYCSEYGLRQHAERRGYSSIQHAANSMDGLVSYIQAVEGELGRALRTQLSTIFAKARVAPGYGDRPTNETPDISIFIDEALWDSPTQRMAVCLVLSHSGDQLRQRAQEVFSRHLGDPFAAGRRRALVKKGLHYTDNSEDLRTDYVTELSFSPIKAYVAFVTCGNTTAERKAAYQRLLQVLLRDRLAKHYASKVNLYVEAGPYATQAELQRSLEQVKASLSKGPRAPLFPPYLTVCDKTELGLATADYVLGVTGRYIGVNRQELDTKRFERLREKIRLLRDLDTGRRYYWKKPFTGVE